MTKFTFTTINRKKTVFSINEIPWNDLHSINDQPALIYPDSSEFWYNKGLIHRKNKPAIIGASGSKYYFKNSQLHNLNGPAIIYSSKFEYWINGIHYNNFKHFIDNHPNQDRIFKSHLKLLNKKYI